MLDADIKVGRDTIGDVMKHDEKHLEKNAHKDKANKAAKNIIYVSIKIKIKPCVRLIRNNKTIHNQKENTITQS